MASSLINFINLHKIKILLDRTSLLAAVPLAREFISGIGTADKGLEFFTPAVPNK